MIKVSLGVKQKEGGIINIDFEPVVSKSSGKAAEPAGVSKLYESVGFGEDMDGSGSRKYLGEIHFSSDENTQLKYKGSYLGNFEIKQLTKYFKKYKSFFNNIVPGSSVRTRNFTL